MYNRINNGADQVVSVWISVMMAFANCLSAAILLGACAGYSLPFFAAAVCVSLTAILRVRIRMKQADDYSRRNEAVMSRFESARYSAIYDMEALRCGRRGGTRAGRLSKNSGSVTGTRKNGTRGGKVLSVPRRKRRAFVPLGCAPCLCLRAIKAV